MIVWCVGVAWVIEVLLKVVKCREGVLIFVDDFFEFVLVVWDDLFECDLVVFGGVE